MTADFIETLACGSVAGICQVFVGHPFDTVKVRLQSGTTLSDALSKNLYKGITSPLLGTSLCNAVVFTAYHNYGREVSSNPWVAGGIAGAIASFAYCPMELYKVRQQLHLPFSLAYPCKGWALTILREIPSFSAYFGVHEELEKRGFGQIMAGGLAGMAAWTVCYPQDVIKTRYQGSIHKITVRQCFTDIYTAQGVKGFFRGLTPALLRSFPANAVTFTVFEFTQNIFKPNKEIN